MALPFDNPSYFIVPNGTLPIPNRGRIGLFRKRTNTTSQDMVSDSILFKENLSTNGRIPLRTLLRSLSSTSTDSNQELLVLGQPRPTDIAPCATNNLDTNRRLKKNQPKVASSEMTSYSPLATSEEMANEQFASEEEEEVFLMEDSVVKYYNLSANREAGRRHSIGTYLSQERDRSLSIASCSKSYREEVPQATVHATLDGDIVKSTSITLEVERTRRSGSYRRRCNDCSAKGSGCTSSCSTGMDDIVIISSRGSEAAALWVNYFGTCFDQISRQKNRPNLKIFNLGIEDVAENSGLSASLEQRVSSVKLNIVIVCPKLLEYVAADPKSSASLCSLLTPDRTIAMLLGVSDEDLSEVHHSALTSYMQWVRHQVGQDQDQDFARDFLSAAMGILTKVTRQQYAASMEERTTFSVMPKKVKQSQNRLIVLLAEPLNDDDTIRISVDKNGEIIEVKSMKRRNPYTLKFTMPDRCLEVSSIVNVIVEKNGNILGARPVKCESRLRELDQILRSVNNPIDFMCQTLGFSPSNTDQLDSWMVHAFQKNLPPQFHLVVGAPGGLSRPDMGTEPRHPAARHPHGHEEFPTLLHFAARYGLEKLAWQLLESPGADAACELRNLGDLTPAEIAEQAGHTKLASALKGYLQMTEFTNMYSQLKEMSKTKDKETLPEVDEDEYLLPRGANSTYSIPPPAKPYNPPTTPTSSSTNNPMTGYLEMQPANKKNGSTSSGRTTPISNGRTTPVTRTNTLTRIPQPDQISNHSIKSQQLKLNNRTPNNNNETPHPDFYEDKVQAELLEIFNDFKNNVFTLPEIEQLVDNWRKRNDVQKSYKEKEDQLNRMRKEYDRIQQMLKDEMKRPTPFDRIKKLFSRKKEPQGATPTFKDLKFDSPLIGKDKTHPEGLQHQGHNQLRPISSLSLQSTASSSSSGRMSTLSACSGMSFGDSGTHSDHEDRKHLMRQTSSDHEYFEIEEHKKSTNLNCNYMIPPAPKPVLKYNPVKQPITALQFHTINERPPHPVPRVETPTAIDQYYIQFPPSGLPVNTSLPMEHKHNSIPIPEEPLHEYLIVHEPLLEYMNIPVGGVQAEHIPEVLPEYINFQPN